MASLRQWDFHPAFRDGRPVAVEALFGIPDAAIAAARSSAYEFFRSPEELKGTVTISAQHRGWLACGGAVMRDDAKPDLKESFIWGYEAEDFPSTGRHALHGENL